MCLNISELWTWRTNRWNSKVMRNAADCDLWIHTNKASCHSVPRDAHWLSVLSMVQQVSLPAHRLLPPTPLGDSQGKLNATPHITHPLGTPVASTTSLRQECVFLICMRDTRTNKENIIIYYNAHTHPTHEVSIQTVKCYKFPLQTQQRNIFCIRKADQSVLVCFYSILS